MSILTKLIKTLSSSTQYYSIDFIDKAFITANNNCKNNYQPSPEVIFGFWTANNPLTENREKSITSIKRNCGVEFKLITPTNLSEYEQSDHPFHPAFQYLSAVHKADYLRTYFMHFYGGGYTDIKPHTQSWRPLFKLLNCDPSAIALGYPENKPKDIAYTKHFTPFLGNKRKINRHIERNYKELIGNCAYIFKPRTSFTELWLTECERRLSLSLSDLKRNPGNLYGNNPGYPLPWNSILGQIFHPLCLAFKEQIMTAETIRPICTNYR